MMLLSLACTEMGLLHTASENLGLSPLGYDFSLRHRSLHEAELLPAPRTSTAGCQQHGPLMSGAPKLPLSLGRDRS